MSTYKKPKTGATIAKTAVALIFIYVGTAPDPEFEAWPVGVCIIIGLALLAWALLRYFSWKENRQKVQEKIEKQEREKCKKVLAF